MIDEKTLDSFIKGIKEGSDIIIKERPDYVLWPLCAGASLSDLFNVVNPSFEEYANKSYYLPASFSKKFEKPAKEWLTNFLDYLNPQFETKIIFVDEVKSGGSVRGLINLIDESVKKFVEKPIIDLKTMIKANSEKKLFYDFLVRLDEKTKNYFAYLTQDLANLFRRYKLVWDNDKFESRNLIDKMMQLTHNLKEEMLRYYSKLLNFKSIGLEHNNGADIDKKSNYASLVKEGRIIPVKVDKIITMDDPDLTPVKYKYEKISNRYLPEVISTTVSSKYKDFLNRVAMKIGRDISNMTFPINQNRILESHKFLNRYYNKDDFYFPSKYKLYGQ